MKKIIRNILGTFTVAIVSTFMGACSCAPSKINVVLDYQGKSNLQSFEIDQNTAFTKPADPVADGYVFDGWYADKDYTIPFDFSKSLVKSTYIYAKWLQVATISLPTTSLSEMGYSLTIQEPKDTYFIGDDITLRLVVSTNYLNNSTPEITANNELLEEHSSQIISEGKEYIYKINNISTVTSILINGININTYSVSFPTLIGATINMVEGYSASNINHGEGLKFTVDVATGYVKENIVVKLNGEDLTNTNGVYEITNIVSNDNVIEITGIEKKALNIKYFDNTTELNSQNDIISSSNQEFEITSDNLSSILFGEDLDFELELLSNKYSEMDLTDSKFSNVITISVAGNSVPYTITKESNKYNIHIDGKFISDNIQVKIASSLFEVNKYTVNLSDATFETEGYSLKFVKYRFNGNDTPITESQKVAQIPFGAFVYVDFISLDTTNYDTSNLKLLTPTSESLYTGQPVAFQIYSDTTISARLNLRYHTVTFNEITGMEFENVNGYEDKAYYKGVKVGEYDLNANTIQFKVNLAEGYTKNNFKVVYYSATETNPAKTEAQAINDVYIISGITSNLVVEVQGIEKITHNISLPNKATGISTVNFVGGSETSKIIEYGNNVEIEVVLDNSHTQSMEKLELLYKGNNCSKVIVDNKIIYTLENITYDIKKEDFAFQNLKINTYIINLPTTRNNYSLQNEEGNELISRITVNYGEDFVIKLVKDVKYSNDNDFIVKVNGQEILLQDNKIILGNISENKTIQISGINTINTYTVKAYKSDGVTEINLEDNNIVYGGVIYLPGEDITVSNYLTLPNNIEEKEHYLFSGWRYATFNGEKYIAGEILENATIVTSDVVVIASFTPVEYQIEYNFNCNGDESLIDNTNPSIFNIEDFTTGKTSFSLYANGLIREGYTFDYFELEEDITMTDGTVLPAGTVITEINSKMLTNIKLKAIWCITVGSSESVEYNYSLLSDAIKVVNISSENINTIKIYSNIIENTTIEIKKSVNIIGEGDIKISANVIPIKTLNNYYGFITINSGLDVIIENISINYSCITTVYDAVAINVYKSNLTLNNVNMDVFTNGVNFVGGIQNKLNIANSNITVSDDQSVGREFGFKISSEGSGIEANISNTTISTNTIIKDFKGIYLANTLFTVSLNLDNVLFTEDESINAENTTAIYSEIENTISLKNISVNTDGKTWNNVIYLNLLNTITGTVIEDKVDFINTKLQTWYDFVIQNDNTFNNCNFAYLRFTDSQLGIIEAFNYIDQSVLTNKYIVSNVTQFVSLVNVVNQLVVNNTEELDLTESALTFTTNHNIDFRNANVKFAFNSSNAGELYNINTLSIFSFENNGTVSANSINIETSLDNNSALNVNDIVVSTSASLINSGDIVTANLTLEKNAILENSNTLTATTISSVGTINNTGNLVTDTITTTILINTSDEILSEPNLTASNLHIVSLIENRVLITAGKFENTGYIKVNTSYSDDQYSTFNNDINATLDTTTAEVDSVATYIISEESQLLSNLDTIKRFVVNTDHTFDLSSDVISIKSYQYIDFGGASVIFADETSNAGTILNANEITVTGFTNSGTITTITLNISKSLINSSVINATGILVAEDAILTINKTLEADSIELAKNASLVNTGTVNCSTITSSGSIRNSGSLTSEKISTVILENSADEVLTEANLIVDNLTISSILESEEVLVNGSLSNTGYIKVNLSYSDDENSVVINEENAVIDRSTAQVNSLATNLTNNGTIIEPESL